MVNSLLLKSRHDQDDEDESVPPSKRHCSRKNVRFLSHYQNLEEDCSKSDCSPILAIKSEIENKVFWKRNDAHPTHKMRTIISGSSDNEIKVWDMHSNKSTRTLRGHEDLVWCFLIRRKNIPYPALISGSWDNTIKVWNLCNGDLMNTLDGHTSIVWCLTFLNDDEKRVVSGSFDNTIKIWCIESGACLRTLLDHTSWIRCVLTLPPSCVQRPNRLRQLFTSYVISGSRDTTIKLWDVDEGECKLTLRGHSDGIRKIIYISECHYLVSSSWDHTIRVWCLRIGTCVLKLDEHASSVNTLILIPRHFNTLNQNHDHMASGSNDNTIKIWNLCTAKCVLTLKGHTSLVKSILLLGADGSGGGFIGRERKSWYWNRGCELISSSNDKTIRIWSLNGKNGEGQCLKVLRGHERSVNCISLLLPHLLVSASSDNTIKVWDLSRGNNCKTENDASKCVCTLNEHEDAVKCIIFY